MTTQKYWRFSEPERTAIQEHMTDLYEQNGETLAQACLENSLSKEQAKYLYDFCYGDCSEEFFDEEWYAAEEDGWGE